MNHNLWTEKKALKGSPQLNCHTVVLYSMFACFHNQSPPLNKLWCHKLVATWRWLHFLVCRVLRVNPAQLVLQEDQDLMWAYLKKISPFCFCYHKFLFLKNVREFPSSPVDCLQMIRTSASILSYVNGNVSIIIIIYKFNNVLISTLLAIEPPVAQGLVRPDENSEGSKIPSFLA